ALIDVRESGEWDGGHLPGARHVPRGYLESRIDAQVPDRSQHVILYCASGQRSALAANTLQELGFEHVESMTGGITLWKDRGYPVEVPKTFTAEQRERYSRHFLLPEVGTEGQQKLLDAKVLLLGAGGLGSPTTTWSTSPTCSARSSTRPTASACRRSTPPRSRSRRSTPTSRSSSTRRAWTPRTSWRSSRAGTSSSTASTTSRPGTS